MPRKKAQDPAPPEDQYEELAGQTGDGSEAAPQAEALSNEEPFSEDGPFPDAAAPDSGTFSDGAPSGEPPLMVEDATEPPSGEQTPPPDDDIPSIEESGLLDEDDASSDTLPEAVNIEDEGPSPEEVQPGAEDEPPATPGPEAEESRTPRRARPAASAAARRTARDPGGILTIEAKDDVMSEEEQEEALWHEIRNAYRTRRMLTGTLGGIEEIGGRTVVILDYKGFRVMVPVKEMMLTMERYPSGDNYANFMRRQNQVLSTMLNAEIDFVVKGIETKSRSIGGSRKDAMMRKRQLFYLDTDASGQPRIYPGRVVQARVTSVAEKVVRVEVFGVECSILARDLAWDWIGDAKERFHVGDRILVRVQEVIGDCPENLTIRADVKSVSSTTNQDKLKKCRVQSKYAGTVTDVRRGVVYVRLTSGVNAIAHACLDRRMPGKKDTVSFAVTRIDEEYGVALGIITRIIKQNL